MTSPLSLPALAVDADANRLAVKPNATNALLLVPIIWKLPLLSLAGEISDHSWCRRAQGSSAEVSAKLTEVRVRRIADPLWRWRHGFC
jgi:hypothetical protein